MQRPPSRNRQQCLPSYISFLFTDTNNVDGPKFFTGSPYFSPLPALHRQRHRQEQRPKKRTDDVATALRFILVVYAVMAAVLGRRGYSASASVEVIPTAVGVGVNRVIGTTDSESNPLCPPSSSERIGI